LGVVEAFPQVDTGAGRLNRAALRRLDDEPDLEAPASNGAVGPDLDGPRLRADDESTAADGTGDHVDLVADIDSETGAADDVDTEVGDEDGSDADVAAVVDEESDEDSGDVEAGAPARRGGRA